MVKLYIYILGSAPSHKITSTRSNYNVSDGVVINNLLVPSVRTSNYGLKQIKVKG